MNYLANKSKKVYNKFKSTEDYTLEPWILLAFGSAIFAGLTSILEKVGVKKVNSQFATAVKTTIAAFFAWILVFSFNQQSQIGEISTNSWIYLILSGLTTGASWLCLFLALKVGEASRVAPITKSSTVLAMFLAFVLLEETLTEGKAIGIVGIIMGTGLMLGIPRQAMTVDMRKTAVDTKAVEVKLAPAVEPKWYVKYNFAIYAGLAAIFEALSIIYGKIGVTDVPAQLAMGIKIIVMLFASWFIVLVTQRKINFKISGRSFMFLAMSGVTIGISWIMYFSALKTGNTSSIVAIEKLSLMVTVLFAWGILKEKVTWSSAVGLIVIVAGTLITLVP